MSVDPTLVGVDVLVLGTGTVPATTADALQECGLSPSPGLTGGPGRPAGLSGVGPLLVLRADWSTNALTLAELTGYPRSAAVITDGAITYGGYLWDADERTQVQAVYLTAADREQLDPGWPRLDDPLAALARTASRSGVGVRSQAEMGAPGATEEQQHLVRLQAASRSDDGWWSTLVLRRLSRPLTAEALRRNWSADAVTAGSLVLGLLTAALFAVGQWPVTVLAALLLQATLVVDCVDGELARYRRRFTERGAWLDGVSDRIKEYAVYAGLAIGAGITAAWAWAAAALVVISVSHFGAFTWDEVTRAQQPGPPPRRGLDDPVLPPPTRRVSAAARLSETSGRNRVVYWIKKVLHLPIGERWLLISAVAILAGGLVTLQVLVVVGLVALLYSFAGRVARTLSAAATATTDGLGRAFADLADLGPGLWRAQWFGGRFGWLATCGARAAEYLALCLLILPVSAPAAFGTLFALALLHYDATYRQRITSGTRPRWEVLAGLGAWPRIALVGLAAALTPAAVVIVSAALSAWLVAVDLATWASWLRLTGRGAR